MRRLLHRIGRSERGATITEFAVVLPVMIVLLMGMMEYAYQAYVQSVLTGAVQKAGRDSGLEDYIGNTSALDAAVLSAVQGAAPRATINAAQSSRTTYSNFRDVGLEAFIDTNGNNKCDNGETYEDANNDGSWDVNQGTSGTGAAGDVVVYKLTITYPRLFPLGWLGMSTTNDLSSSTTLRNQPYRAQATTTIAKRTCN